MTETIDSADFVIGVTMTPADKWWLEKTLSAIARGAELLDDISPGWEDLISLEDIDMGNLNACIAGQVFLSKVVGAAGYVEFDSLEVSIYNNSAITGYGYIVEYLSENYVWPLLNQSSYWGFEDYMNQLNTSHSMTKGLDSPDSFDEGYSPWFESDLNICAEASDRYEDMAKLWIVQITIRQLEKELLI